MKNVKDMLPVLSQVEEALQKQGIEIIGGGVGQEIADLSVIIDGKEYWISIALLASVSD